MFEHFASQHWLLPSVFGCALAASGCYAAHERSPGLDAPPTDVLDAGRGTADAASDASARSDARLRPDAGAECAAEVADYDGPGCAVETRECLGSCSDDEECDECVLRDIECVRCVNTVIVACANRVGCAALWSPYACCAAEDPACDGAGPVPLNCTSACDAELALYAQCVNDGPAMDCSIDVEPRCGLF